MTKYVLYRRIVRYVRSGIIWVSCVDETGVNLSPEGLTRACQNLHNDGMQNGFSIIDLATINTYLT